MDVDFKKRPAHDILVTDLMEGIGIALDLALAIGCSSLISPVTFIAQSWMALRRSQSLPRREILRALPTQKSVNNRK